jgi:hypothetical protein
VSGVISIILILNIGDCCRLEIYKVVMVFLRDLSLLPFDVSLGATVAILQELARVLL